MKMSTARTMQFVLIAPMLLFEIIMYIRLSPLSVYFIPLDERSGTLEIDKKHAKNEMMERMTVPKNITFDAMEYIFFFAASAS